MDEDQIEEPNQEPDGSGVAWASGDGPEAGVEGASEPPPPRSRRKLVRNLAGLGVILGAAGAGIGVAVSSSSAAAGSSTRSATAPSPRTGAPGARSGGFPTGATGRSGFGGTRTAPTASGTVASIDASAETFTVKESSGAVKTVTVTSSTTYLDFTVKSATIADVVAGKQVAVFGTSSSGTITATRVMIGTPGTFGASRGKPPTGATAGTAA